MSARKAAWDHPLLLFFFSCYVKYLNTHTKKGKTATARAWLIYTFSEFFVHFFVVFFFSLFKSIISRPHLFQGCVWIVDYIAVYIHLSQFCRNPQYARLPWRSFVAQTYSFWSFLLFILHMCIYLSCFVEFVECFYSLFSPLAMTLSWWWPVHSIYTNSSTYRSMIFLETDAGRCVWWTLPLLKGKDFKEKYSWERKYIKFSWRRGFFFLRILKFVCVCVCDNDDVEVLAFCRRHHLCVFRNHLPSFPPLLSHACLLPRTNKERPFEL